jgi:hypothetical protein
MVGRTSTVYKSLSPQWNEQVLAGFQVPEGSSTEQVLRFVLVDESRDHEDEKLGVVVVSLEDCRVGHVPCHVTLDVEACPGCEDASGTLEVIVALEHKQEPEERKQQERELEEARRRKKASGVVGGVVSDVKNSVLSVF